MARPRKITSIDEEIAKQEEVVSRSKTRYDADVKKLKDLCAKRDEEKRKALLQAIEKSGKTYDEIMEFLTSEDAD